MVSGGAAGVECEMSQQQEMDRRPLLGFDSATLQGRPAYQRDGLHVVEVECEELIRVIDRVRT